MSEEIKNGATAEAPVKKNRRGISNETKAVSQLKFHEKDAAQNGLFIGHMADVALNWAVAKEGTSFAGLKMPYLTFHFVSEHKTIAEQRNYYHSIFPVESNIATIPGGSDEWRVNNVFNFIKHILDTFYLRNRQLTEQEENDLSLPFCDTDDNGEYVMIDPQVVLDGYGTMFTTVINMLEGKYNLAEGEVPKPCYKDANGKPITLWMKLLRHRKVKKGWVNITPNGDLGFDGFIGNGVIEIFKGQGTMPAILRLDLSKESITPKDTKKEPNLNIPGMPGNMMGGGVMVATMPAGIPTDNSAFAAAGEDMPF